MPFASAPDATALDAVRAALVLALAVAQAATAFWPELRGWRHTIASRSAALGTPVVPIGPTFAIWGPIFLSCLAFGLWQALPANLADPTLRSIGWVASLLFAANVAWEAWVPRRGLDAVSVALVALELVAALWLLVAIGRSGPSGARWWLVAFPFQLFAGWVSAAAFVNLSSTLRRAAETDPVRRGALDPRRTPVALALIIAAATLAFAVSLTVGAWPYTLAVAWAFGGIVLANRARPGIARASAALAAALLAVAALAAATGTPHERRAVHTLPSSGSSAAPVRPFERA